MYDIFILKVPTYRVIITKDNVNYILNTNRWLERWGDPDSALKFFSERL